MKKILNIIVCLLLSLSVFAQNNLIEYEYWINDNYSAKYSQTITPTETFRLQTTIPCQNLETGIHTLNVRFKGRNDTIQYWSSVVSSHFYKMPELAENKIVAYEYWLDDQYSNRTQETVTASSTIHLSQSIEFENLETGIHAFHIRFKDQKGTWSSVASQHFYKMPELAESKMVLYEYWFNGDYESRIVKSINNEQTFILLDSLDVSSVTESTNTISYRFKDNTGLWSSTTNSTFYLKSVANFTHIVGLSEVAFTNKSIYADTYLWDFGDGTTSNQVNPLHTYTEPGAYAVKLTASNSLFSDNITHYVEKTGIRTIFPNKAGNDGQVTINIYGGGFTSQSNVFLRNEEIEISADETYLIDYGVIRATFNFIEETIGIYDIVVVTDNVEVSINDAFEIEEVIEPNAWIELNSQETFMSGRWQTFTIHYGNNGNIDVLGMPVYLAIPNYVDIEFGFEFYDPIALEDVTIDTVMYDYVSVDYIDGQAFNGKVYAFLIPYINANSEGQLKFKIKSTQNYNIYYWNQLILNDLYYMQDNTANNIPSLQKASGWNTIDCIIAAAYTCSLDGVVFKIAGYALDGFAAASCVGGVIKAQYDAVKENCTEDLYSGVGTHILNWGKHSSLALANCVIGGVKLVSTSIKIVREIYEWSSIMYNCSSELSECKSNNKDKKKRPITVVQSYDPNEIVGVSGYDNENYIQKKQYLHYTVYFENDAELATAPAQVVDIIDTLDLTKFNPAQFSFGTFTFRNITVEAIPNITEFSRDIDMRTYGENIIVRITATFDKATGIIRCHFIAFDPVTMDLTESPFLGVLYPNTEPPIGEANFTYRAGLLPSVTHGDIVENQAHIIFDLNEPIATNVFINTIDTIKPASTMSFVQINDTTYTVSWHGTDNGSGVRNYTVYVSENSEDEFLVWQYNTTETSAVFIGKNDSTYRFYCIATDNVGNREDIKPYQIEISMLPSNIPEVTENSFVKIYPNPAKKELFIVSESKIEKVEIYTLTGSLVAAENNFIEKISTKNFAEGVYLVKIYTNKGVVIKRVIKN